MAFLGIKVPSPANIFLSQIKVEGEKTPINEMHITLLYFGEEYPLDKIAKAIDIIQKEAADTSDFMVQTRQVSHFEGHKEGKCAVIAKMTSPDLHNLRSRLAKACQKADISFSTKFKEYRPHVTLSYAEQAPKDFTIPPIQFKVKEITLWGGESMDDKIIISFPLGKSNKHAGLIHKIEMFEKLAGL